MYYYLHTQFESSFIFSIALVSNLIVILHLSDLKFILAVSLLIISYAHYLVTYIKKN